MCDGVEGPTQACAEGLVANAPSQDAASAGGVEIVTAVTEGGEPAVAAAKEGGEEVLRLGEPPRVRCKSWAAVDSSSGQVMRAKMKTCA